MSSADGSPVPVAWSEMSSAISSSDRASTSAAACTAASRAASTASPQNASERQPASPTPFCHTPSPGLELNSTRTVVASGAVMPVTSSGKLDSQVRPSSNSRTVSNVKTRSAAVTGVPSDHSSPERNSCSTTHASPSWSACSGPPAETSGTTWKSG